MSSHVSYDRAVQIAVARLAQLDQAIAAVDRDSLTGELLNDIRSGWENVPVFLARFKGDPNQEFAVGAIAKSAITLADQHRDDHMTGPVTAWVEISAMFRTGYLEERAAIKARLGDVELVILDQQLMPTTDQEDDR